MKEFKDFELTDFQIERIKENNMRKGISDYIRNNGVEPEDANVFYKLNEGDVDKYRRLYYSIYLSKYQKIPFKGISKICDYLYEATCTDVDYEYAFKHYMDQKVEITGGCSSMRSGNFFGRNFDWYYNHDTAFVIHTPRLKGRYASLGMAGCNPALSMSTVDSGSWVEAYKIFPFFLLDGINEWGVFVNDNVVPGQDMETHTTGTTPLKKKKGDLCMNMIVRFILDNYKTAREAVEDIRDHWSVFSADSELLGDYEVHFTVGDYNETFILEFFNNEVKILPVNMDGSKLAIMTNFFLNNVNLINGKVGDVGENLSGVTPFGSGIERYNILVDAFENAGLSKDNMMEAMKSVWYSNAYDKTKFWASEMVGAEDRVKNDEELLERTELFFTMCEETGQQPLWELYCSSLGYSVETIRLWANGTQTGFSEDTKGILNLARQTIMSIDASAASEGKMQPIVYIFRAKNYYGADHHPAVPARRDG